MKRTWLQNDMLTAITSKIRTKEGREWDGSAHRKKDLSHIAPPVVRVVIAKHLTDGSQIVVREHDCFRQTGRAAGKNHCRTSFAGILSVQDICFGWDRSLVVRGSSGNWRRYSRSAVMIEQNSKHFNVHENGPELLPTES
jgi:hypothetical protein